jgi:hypothetical protein
MVVGKDELRIELIERRDELVAAVDAQYGHILDGLVQFAFNELRIIRHVLE